MAGPITLKSSVDPLTYNVPIVDAKTGNPTLEFQRKWLQQKATNTSIPDLTTAAAVSAVLDVIASTVGSLLVRGSTQWAGLSPSADGKVLRDKGPGAQPIWDTISDVLDTIANTRGGLLYRGAAGWAVLPPSAAGKVLTDGGTGADPSWQTASGGNGSAASSFFLDGTHGYVAEVDSNGILVLDGSGRGVYSVDPVLPIKMIPYATGFRFGGKTSNNSGTPNTKIDIAAFTGRDSTDTFNIKSSTTLTIDATTVGANGLDAGSLANTTSYFSFVIAKADGTTASLLSTSPTAPTLPSGYLYFRRVGSHRTDGSAHFLVYVQTDKSFLLATSIQDLHSVNPGTSAIVTTLSVPASIIVFPILTVNWVVDNSLTFLVSPTAVPDTAPSFPANMTAAVTGATAGNTFVLTHIPTDTSRQVRTRTNASDAGITLNLVTAGWIDPLLD